MLTSQSTRTAVILVIGVAALLTGLWFILQIPQVWGERLNVVVSDHSVTTDAAVVSAGKVTFAVKNRGTKEHELILIKTDLPARELKTQKADEQLVDEEASGKVLGEVEDLAPGKTGSLTLTLAPGKYVLFCNIPGHYKMGLFTAIEVK